jgi:hypothetical protein
VFYDRQWVLLSFSLKKKVTKEKVAAGFCCYELVVVGQGQELPQHYQCCPREGYPRTVVGSHISKLGLSSMRAVARQKRGPRVGLWEEAFFCLDFLVHFGSSQKN